MGTSHTRDSVKVRSSCWKPVPEVEVDGMVGHWTRLLFAPAVRGSGFCRLRASGIDVGFAGRSHNWSLTRVRQGEPTRGVRRPSRWFCLELPEVGSSLLAVAMIRNAGRHGNRIVRASGGDLGVCFHGGSSKAEGPSIIVVSALRATSQDDDRKRNAFVELLDWVHVRIVR